MKRSNLLPAILAGVALAVLGGCGLTHASEAHLAYPGPAPDKLLVRADGGHIVIGPETIRACWDVVGGHLKGVDVSDPNRVSVVRLSGEVFSIVLGDKTVVHSGQMLVTAGPTIEKIAGKPGALRLADRCAGQQVACKLHDPTSGLDVQWKVLARTGSNYVREEVTVLPGTHDVQVGKIILFDQPAGAAKVCGVVNGSPVLLNQIFFGLEHPMAQNAIQRDWTSVGKWSKQDLKKNETTTLTYDVPAAVQKSGAALEVQFEASDGDTSLLVQDLALLVDGKEAARDVHPGESGDIDEHNIYRVTLPALHGGEKVQVLAHVKPARGVNVIGDVTVSIPPAVPQLQCLLERNATLKAGEMLTASMVFGATPAGQTRRGFLYYLERERAHVYRPFLHYNSWYDVGYFGRRFSEADCLDVINRYSHEMVEKRGVPLQSYLWDDGWDDPTTLWGFNEGLPNGFTAVEAAAAKHGADVGMWLSPFGGYGPERAARLKYGTKEGFETNGSGFSLSGPKYYQRFREITLKFVKDYHANQFKFDGIAVGGQVTGQQTRDGDAMLRLIAELRSARADLFINQTTGTYASPFWLLHVDSTWRGGEDNSYQGTGSFRQQWITYRDADVFRRVITQGPLYPLNSLMLHGIVLATHAGKLKTATDEDFRDEARSYFGTGTNLQEMYITPSLMNDQKWDYLAAAAKWSAANAATLIDTHWVGGDPGQGQVYGWAAWSADKGILTLRNPTADERSITLDAAQVFELPAGAPQSYPLHGVYADQRVQALDLTAGKALTVTLKPYEVLVFEGRGQ